MSVNRLTDYLDHMQQALLLDSFFGALTSGFSSLL